MPTNPALPVSYPANPARPDAQTDREWVRDHRADYERALSRYHELVAANPEAAHYYWAYAITKFHLQDKERLVLAKEQQLVSTQKELVSTQEQLDRWKLMEGDLIASQEEVSRWKARVDKKQEELTALKNRQPRTSQAEAPSAAKYADLTQQLAQLDAERKRLATENEKLRRQLTVLQAGEGTAKRAPQAVPAAPPYAPTSGPAVPAPPAPDKRLFGRVREYLPAAIEGMKAAAEHLPPSLKGSASPEKDGDISQLDTPADTDKATPARPTPSEGRTALARNVPPAVPSQPPPVPASPEERAVGEAFAAWCRQGSALMSRAYLFERTLREALPEASVCVAYHVDEGFLADEGAEGELWVVSLGDMTHMALPVPRTAQAFGFSGMFFEMDDDARPGDVAQVRPAVVTRAAGGYHLAHPGTIT